MSVEQQPTRTSGKAIASLILGIASLLFWLFTGIPAIILGIMGLREITSSNGRVTGQGMAISGIAVGALGILAGLPVIAVLIGLLLPAVQQVRSAANRISSQNNLKVIALAMVNYEHNHKQLPPAVVYDKEGRPLYSWRVVLLPYLGQNDLHQQFRLDEPWDSPHNHSLLARMPKVYLDPSADRPESSETFYQVLLGSGAAFEARESFGLDDGFPDGANRTFLLAEAADCVPWTKPADLSFAPGQPLPRFGTRHGGGFNAVMVDGAARLVPPTTSENTLRALITRNGGEAVQWP